MVSLRSVLLAIKHPDLVMDFLRGASLQDLDSKVHASAYWSIELRNAIFREIGKVERLNKSRLENLSTREFIDSCLMPLDLRYAKAKFGELSHVALYLLCRKIRPEVVVETGVQAGITSSVLLRALRENEFGRLYSIDLPNAEYTTEEGRAVRDYIVNNQSRAFRLDEADTGYAVPDELRHNWSLILGDAKEELEPLLKRLKSVDFFFHDSEHSYKHMMWEFHTAWPYIRKGGILAVHDIDWNKSFDDFCSEIRSPHFKLGGFGVALKDERGVPNEGIVLSRTA